MNKTLMLMWLTALLCLPGLASAQQPDDKEVRLTMTFNDEALTEALLRLEKASSYHFLFTYDDLAPYRVTGELKEARFTEAVEFVLKDKPLTYVVDGQFVNITLVNAPADSTAVANSGDMQSVGGFVTDEHDEPLPGAQVRVVGTNVAAITDLDGAFHFDYYLGGRNQVQVTFMGMKPVTVPLRKEMRIRMASDDKVMRQVVVTGIFQKAKESYTGAITTIDKEQLEIYRGQNLLQTLKHIDASINIPTNNLVGSDPNALPNINIRGTASLPMSVEEFNQNVSQQVNTPLIIMDGFEISLQKLMDYNDEQIESINILKDAAATAIYGSRGANGVIVIVTKTPKEGRLRVTARAGVSLELPDLSSYHVLDAARKLELEKLVGLYTFDREPARQLLYDGYYNERLKTVLDGTDIDWLSKPLRNGVGQRYNMRLDGGQGQFRWGVSLGYNDIHGAMKGSQRQTVTGDITLMYSVKGLIFRNYTSVASNNARNSKYGSFQTYVDQQPYNNPYDADGNLVRGFYDLDHSATLVGNPLYDAQLGSFNKNGYFEFMDNFSVEWTLKEVFRLRAKMGLSTNRNTSDIFTSAKHSMFNTPAYSTEAGIFRRGRYVYGTGDNTLLSADVTASYSKLFAEKHQLYVGFDYSISQNTEKSYSFTAEGFNNENLSFLGNALQYLTGGAPSGDRSTTRMVGFTGNANYTFDNRFYLDLSFRTDGSSRFGSDNRFAPFWSSGIGWNLHNERFLNGNRVLNIARLRASYGLTGSQDFSTSAMHTTYKYYSNNSYMNWTAAEMTGLGNSALTWQKTRQINLGFEVSMFKARLAIQGDVYQKVTGNLLSSMDLPLSTGYSSYTANIGEMKNSGFEVSVNAYPIRDTRRQITLMIGGQLVYNRNKITRLSDAIVEQNQRYLEQNVEVGTLFYVGKPMSSIYAVRSLGIDPSTGEEIFLDKDGGVTRTFKSANMVFLGSSQPLYRGNANMMLRWRGLTLNLSFGYHWGGKLYNTTLRDRVEVNHNTIASKNVDERVFSQRWAHPGDVTFFRNFDDNVATHATSRYVMDDRVLELQSASVQYRLANKKLKQKLHTESMLFSINANELFYLSSVRYERGTNYPFARNIQAALTLTF